MKTYALITSTVKTLSFSYFKAEGLPEQVVDLLSNNYQAMAQTANLLAEWLILAGTVLHSREQNLLMN